MKKKKKQVGRKPIAKGEDTLRKTICINEKLFCKAKAYAEDSFSDYVRDLIERDLKRKRNKGAA